MAAHVVAARQVRLPVMMACGAIASAFAAGSSARAESGLSLGVDIGIHRVLDNQGINGSWGPGFDGRAGYQFDLGIVRLTPEARIGYRATGAPEVFWAGSGLRASFLDFIVMPVVFAHVGGVAGDLSGFAWDAGGGVELPFGPLNLGLFVAYDRIEDQDLEFAGGTNGGNVPWESIRIAAMFTFVP